MRTTSGKLLEAGVVIKAVGFETNAANSRLLGRTHMRSNGLVDRDLWLLVEPHLDKGAFNSPFGSSYLNSATYGARSMLRYWQNPDLMGMVLAAPLPLVPIDTFTASDVLSGAAALAAVDPEAPVQLEGHLKAPPYMHICICIHITSACACCMCMCICMCMCMCMCMCIYMCIHSTQVGQTSRTEDAAIS